MSVNMTVYIVDLNGTSGAGDLTSTELDTAASKIVNEIQLGNFSEIINVSQDTTYSIAEPPPSPSSSEWEKIKTDDNPYTSLYVVDAMVFKPALVPQHEGVPFATQPKIQIVDKNVRITMLSLFLFCNQVKNVSFFLLKKNLSMRIFFTFVYGGNCSERKSNLKHLSLEMYNQFEKQNYF